MKYRIPDQGEWVQPIMNGYKMGCCDCGLVHKMDFRIHEDRVQFRVWRDERATGQKRRHKKINIMVTPKHAAQKKVNKGNNLIIKFMRSDDYSCWRYTRLKYHSSWDWLMPVIEKIENLNTVLADGRETTLNYIVSIEDTSCIVSIGGESEVVCCQAYDTEKTKIEVTWEAVVEFINWYNQNK